jgi:dethiobiotin synthetase
VRGLFVTGTDTGVGKTVLSAALVAAMRAERVPVRAYKPVLTGMDEPVEGSWPRDHELLGEAAGMSPEAVAPLRFGPATSPHLAAELAGVAIEPADLLAGARALADQAGPDGLLVVEGVGGLLVPLCDGYAVRELAAELRLALVIAARPGLGTINHTLLTLEAARAAGLNVAAIVLTPWPERPDEIAQSNRRTLQESSGVPVQTLPALSGPRIRELAAAGSQLDWRGWLGHGK